MEFVVSEYRKHRVQLQSGSLKEFIELNSNQKYREFSESLSSAGNYRMKGVRLPVLRAIKVCVLQSIASA